MRIYLLVGHEFGEKVVGNLVNLPTFCDSCNLACDFCRIGYGSFVQDIVGLQPIPLDLPQFIDNPEKYLPKNVPKTDIIIPIGIHQDILSSIPDLASKSDASAVIVPIENRTWCPPAMRKQLEDDLDEIGVEHAFPKPFCNLDHTGKKTVDQFINEYAIGRPKIKLELDGEMIKNVFVSRSAPCGNTWYVAQQLRFTNIKDFNQNISDSHHGYPCTASMDIDPEIEDTILHKAGYIIREAAHKALREEIALKKLKITDEINNVLNVKTS